MLEVRDFSITYNCVHPPLPAIRDISFSISAGESIGIIGESGCGKTTLALGMMGLLRDADIRGRVIFRDHDLLDMDSAMPRRHAWRDIAMVFQNSLEVFNPVIPIGEQIAEPLRTHLGLSVKAAGRRVRDLLRMVDLEQHWEAGFAHQLSGGMRQRAMIAMALGCEPDLLIVDEPTTSLDAQSRREIMALLETLKKRMGFAMILISHFLPAVQRLTSKMMTLYAGRVVEQGMTAEVLKNPLHPYTRGLMNASPDFFPYKDLWGIAGTPPRPGQAKGCGFARRCCQASSGCTKSQPELVTVGIERKVACHKGGIKTVLRAVGLTKHFRLRKRTIKALTDASINVRSGEVVALVGRSGSGKSTLAHILACVLTPDAGEVRFFDKAIHKREATAVMGGIQIVFQDPTEAISHRFSVLDAVREPLDIIGWQDRSARDEKAVAAIGAMHLSTDPDFLDRKCHALSGGQRQRVSIARALVMNPAVLVADEVTTMLDPSTQAIIIRELKTRQHESGFCMLFITHDLSLARKIADKVIVLDGGEIVEQGAAFDVFGRLSNKSGQDGLIQNG